jgi:hypothetical protein
VTQALAVLRARRVAVLQQRVVQQRAGRAVRPPWRHNVAAGGNETFEPCQLAGARCESVYCRCPRVQNTGSKGTTW